MHKKILNSMESKKAAATAIAGIADIVSQTLGPGGNPVVIQQDGVNPDGTPKSPIVTKDGVTVAQHVNLRDPALNTFVQTIIQVAENTVKEGGDGTTTSIILANAIFRAGLKRISQGTNGIQLFNDLKAIKDELVERINTIKTNVADDADVINIAKISANGDEDIANIVFDAIEAVGEDGYVSLEEGFTRKTTLETIKGAVYKQGWRGFGPLGSHQVTNKATNTCELSEPAILLYAGKLDNVDTLGKFIARIWDANDEGIYQTTFPLLIVANDYSDEIKNGLMAMRVNSKLPVAAIKSPFDGSPNARTEMLEDLAALVGATVSAKGILELDDVGTEHLGGAKKIDVGMEETVIFEGYGDKNEILDRIEDLKRRMEIGDIAEYDKDNVRLRIGKLSGGIAVVKVGGDSELEMKEKKDRIEDALCAAKVAIQDGIIPGGGYILYNLAKNLKEENEATAIMKEALQAPIKQIITNAGDNPDVVLSHMHNGHGYDAVTHTFCNLLEEGIVDPAKVTKAALENAVSIAGLLLTTGGALVSDALPKDGQSNPLAGLLG